MTRLRLPALAYGIPPCPERILMLRRRRILGVAAVLTVVALMGAFYLTGGPVITPDDVQRLESFPAVAVTSGPGLEEAFAAAKGYVETFIMGAGGQVSRWRDRTHDREGEDYVFVGYIDVTDTEGILLPTVYRVHVRRSTEGAWELVDLQVDTTTPP